ncbi:MAG: hypothetical protein ACJ79H_10035 [Myxococcales bacterium]
MMILVLLLVLVLTGGAADTVISAVTNGPIVGPITTIGDDGLVDADPAELAADAGLDVNVYALARCMASEHARDADLYLFCVGWAVRNMAAEQRESVLELLTNGAGSAGDGYFGEQKASAGTKYASTAHDPHQRHVDAAQAVIYGTVPDPTGGATHFFSPMAQDDLAEKAAAGDARFRKYLGKDADFIMRSWAAPGGLYAQGAEPIVPAGIDPRRLTLWRAA